MTDYGYIMLNRKMFDGGDKLWEEKRTRTKAEAWIDLIQLANWRAGRMLVGNDAIELQRGEFLASVRYLSRRWHWSTKKCWAFLKMLEGPKWKRIRKQRTTPQGNIYLIVNYDSYQTPGNTHKTDEGNTKGDSKETPRKHLGNETNTVKQLRSENKNTPLAPDDIKQTPDMNTWCAALEEKIGNKQPWNRKYWSIWQRYIESIGLDWMLEAIKHKDFDNVEYLLKPPEGETEICFLEDIELRVKEEEWRELKQSESVNPDVVDLFESTQMPGPTDEQIKAALRRRDNSP